MEPGTGKTLTALAYCVEKAKTCKERIVVVVAPAIVQQVWETELAKWFPEDYVLHYSGKSLVIPKDNDWHFCMLTLNAARQRSIQAVLASRKVLVAIFDESHLIKNYRSQISEAVFVSLKPISCFRVCMTGTPILNTLLDAWNQVRFIDDTVLGNNYVTFMRDYAIMGGYYDYQIVGVKHRAKLKEKINTVSFFITKAECLDLPELTINPIYLEIKRPEHIERNAEGFRRIKTQLQSCATGRKKNVGEVMSKIGPELISLMRIANGLYNTESGQAIGDPFKLKYCCDFVDYLMSLDKKVVVFYKFDSDGAILEYMIHQRDVTAGRLAGSTKPVARKSLLINFKEMMNPRVLLVQQSLGLGIDLSCADICIFFSRDYRHGDYKQCLDRLHRMGQRNPVTAYLLLTKDSIDEVIHKKLERKATDLDFLMGLHELSKKVLG